MKSPDLTARLHQDFNVFIKTVSSLNGKLHRRIKDEFGIMSSPHLVGVIDGKIEIVIDPKAIDGNGTIGQEHANYAKNKARLWLDDSGLLEEREVNVTIGRIRMGEIEPGLSYKEP